MCLTAWNDPIGTPNCRRSFTCATARSSTRCDAPTVAAASPTTASSSGAGRAALDAGIDEGPIVLDPHAVEANFGDVERSVERRLARRAPT